MAELNIRSELRYSRKLQERLRLKFGDSPDMLDLILITKKLQTVLCPASEDVPKKSKKKSQL